MIKIVKELSNWPRTKDGDPIFFCSNDAKFYASLVVHDETERLRLLRLRENVKKQYKAIKSLNKKDLDHMMELALENQYYTVCLEEIERIEKEGK